MALPYDVLLTPDEVRDATQDDGPVTLTFPRDQPLVEGHIASVTAELEGYLRRRLIVRAHSDRPAWRGVCSTQRAYLRQWPVVQLDTEDVEMAGTSDEGEVAADPAPATVAYHAGYRRADQTLSDLQDEDACPDLTETPALLPADIRQLALDYVLYRLSVQRVGVGLSSTSVDTGSGVVNRTGVRAAWWDENRSRIAHHRSPFL